MAANLDRTVPAHPVGGDADRPGEQPEQIVRRDADGMREGDRLPFLMTAGETAALLRTSRKGVYAMIERRQLPGITRVGRRVLINSDELVDWLRQKCTPSPKG